jgi:ABC-2 type transport system permease protein
VANVVVTPSGRERESMSAATVPTTTSLAQPGGLLTDLGSVARRALRLTVREPEAVLPALIIPLFFFVVNVGALQKFVEASAPPGFSYKAFQLPLAIITAVTGVSRANSLVTDIQDGYFDRLLLTPIRRVSLLLGLMVADFVLVIALTIPVLILGFVIGVRFETGLPGVLVFMLLAGFWGLVFTGFPYAIALRTGNPAAVNSSFLLFFPFVFLTTAFLPKEALTGWLAAIASVNPVTYMLAAMRSLIQVGWDSKALGQAVAAIAIMGAVSMPMAFAALRGRLKRG